jgi:hypothetical protein
MECMMADNSGSNGFFGAVLGGLVALAALLMVLSGGSLGGKQTVSGDADLPPVTSPAPR